MKRQRRARAPRNGGFTLVETLVVAAVIGIVAALLAPALASSREAARRAACTANLRQAGLALRMYTHDYGDRLPDRRDLKLSLPGGYRPWTSWPPSDPRAGWAAVTLDPYVRSAGPWACPSVAGSPLGEAVQVLQATPAGATRYWMWRFDRPDEPVLLDNLWGKTDEQAVQDLRAAANPQAGKPDSPTDVEVAVDPYFPATIATVPAHLRGRAVHFGGRSRLMLDGHVKWLRDTRTR